MKKILYALLGVVALGFTACQSSDQPEEHGEIVFSNPLAVPAEIAKIEVVAIEGHLHGTYGFHESADPVGQKYLKRFHKFIFEKKDNTFELSNEGNTKLFAVGGLSEEGGDHHEGHDHGDADGHDHSGEEGTAAYGFWIDYFDAKGNKITSKILENGLQATRQHFFVARNMAPTFDGDIEEIKEHDEQHKFMDYLYCDTDPLSGRIKDGAQVIGATNPVGHKGYFYFFVPRAEFTLDIVLSDMAAQEKLHNGAPRKFFEYSSNAKDLVRLSIPVYVYAHGYETVEEESYGEAMSNPISKKYLESVARAYGITTEEAFDAAYNRVAGDVPPHSDAGYWF